MTNLGEPRVPKPSNQGGARPNAPKQPIKSRPGQSAAPASVTKRGVHTSGTNGTGSKNNPKRT